MDDPYPREGSYYQAKEPAHNKSANAEEKKRAEEAMPFIDGVLEWLDAVVDETDSIALAIQLSKQYNKTVDETVIALDIAHTYLQQKKGELRSLASTLRR